MKFNVLIILLVVTFINSYSQGEAAIYIVTFDSNWSQETHPHPNGSLPNSAHWSRLVGAIHNNEISFLTMGELSTQGIENIAESGSNGAFNNEVNNAITAGTAIEYIDLGDLDSDLGQIIGTIQATTEHSLISLISMIAPSPDWIIAIDSIALLNDANEWEEEISIDLYPYDAGTDNGTDYTSGNSDTNPAQPISSLQGVAPFSSEKIGTITLSLDEVLSTNDVNTSRKIRMYPNPTNGIINISLFQENGSIRIYDITGKLVDSKPLETGITQLDYNFLSPGMYMISLETATKQTIQKLIKQ